MNRRIAVRAIIVNDGKFLAVKLNAYREATKGDFWCTIGGGVDPGEALIPALEREVFEETGIHPVVGNLLYVQQFSEPAKNLEHIEFFFHITNSADFLNIDIAASTHGAQEIKEISFVSPDKEHILPKFLTEQNYQDLLNEKTLFFNYL
jgi:8-oxo-dGTP pyrophosphatase MutT (NUDIX family)